MGAAGTGLTGTLGCTGVLATGVVGAGAGVVCDATGGAVGIGMELGAEKDAPPSRAGGRNSGCIGGRMGREGSATRCGADSAFISFAVVSTTAG